MKIKIKNLILAFKDQGPFLRFIRNLKKGHILGILNERSHLNGEYNLKVMYNTKKAAIKTANTMTEKYGKRFSNYKCIYCDGYHVGKNRENK